MANGQSGFKIDPGRCQDARQQTGQTFVLAHPDTSRQLTIAVDAALQTECITGQTEPVPLGWYSDGFYHREPSPTLRTWLTLLPNQSITLRHRLVVGAPTLAPPVHQANTINAYA